ncbi:TadE/TadG family type IV pilus assembly protein [Sphingobium bisphenolivorans]|uniref:TadE/TadG family type IV pilus assembly protein n=1 Tax=Sphingobium bisphenolivorans TaxID=1335760 RepID=UPI00039BAA3D|nr:TadE/TadG family type IV pilus assembly protein [Sphingobium bisphenolivorans]
MSDFLYRLGRNRVGSSAAEFALVLPLLLIFLIGILDVGRLMWTWNRAEKATQMGARFAVVTDPVPSGLSTFSFVGTGGLTQGDAIPSTAYGTMTCTSSGTSVAVSCSCTSGSCPWGATAASGTTSPFARIADRMHLFFPELTANNIRIAYKPSGLGYAGDPNGADIAPIVTVEVRNLTFTPTLLQLFGGQLTLPSFSSALTLEDSRGLSSN